MIIAFATIFVAVLVAVSIRKINREQPFIEDEIPHIKLPSDRLLRRLARTRQLLNIAIQEQNHLKQIQAMYIMRELNKMIEISYTR